MPASVAEPAGVLCLEIVSRGGKSVATRQYHEGALRVLRPHYLDCNGQVTYTVINPGGAYFGADTYELDFSVAEDAELTLTTQSATKVYKTPQGPAIQNMRIRVAGNGVFEYLPDQLIVYRQGAYRQHTLVQMAPSSTVVLAEIMTPGWSPTGEDFHYDELSMRTEIQVIQDGTMRRLAVDRLRIKPHELTGLSGMGMMEGFTHTGQLLIADARLSESLFGRILELLEESSTRSGLTRAGTDQGFGVKCWCVRSLAHSTSELMDLQHRIVNEIRAATRGQNPLNLRKN